MGEGGTVLHSRVSGMELGETGGQEEMLPPFPKVDDKLKRGGGGEGKEDVRAALGQKIATEKDERTDPAWERGQWGRGVGTPAPAPPFRSGIWLETGVLFW